MRQLFHLVRKEWLLLLRDWHALLLLFAMPAMFILVMSLALRDRFATHQGVALDYYLLVEDDDEISAELAERLARERSFRLRETDASSSELLARVAADEAHFLVVVPEGFGAAIGTDEPVAVRIAAAPGVEPALSRLFETAVRGQAERLRAEEAIGELERRIRAAAESARAAREALEGVTRGLSGDDPRSQDEREANGGGSEGRGRGTRGAIGDWELELRAGQEVGQDATSATEEDPVPAFDFDASEELVVCLSLYRQGAEAKVPSAVQQNVPAWLMFAMFFIAIPLSTTWVQERQQGTSTRLRAIGIARRWLLLGKLVPYFAINLLQVVSMLAVGVWLVPLFGGDALTLGDSPVGLLVIAFAASFASVSYALLIANLVSTSEQATIFTGVSNLLLAAIGGIMVPRFVMPAAMQTLSSYSPMAWGMEGFLDVFLRQGGVAEVAGEALRLAALGLACLGLAAFAMRRRRA